MPVSFWIFLFVCGISFIPVIRDHGEAWRAFKESKGHERCRKGLNFFALWSIAIFSLCGTLALGIESFFSERQDARREAQYRIVTNQLGQAKSQLTEATNELAKALDTADLRTITEQKSNDFIKLVKGDYLFDTNFDKRLPIKVFVGLFSDGKTYNYAKQIRAMLNAGGFKDNSGADVLIMQENLETWGRTPARKYDVIFLTYGTNDQPHTTLVADLQGVRFSHVCIDFQTIGIIPEGCDSSNWLKPGEFGIYVPPKIH